MAIKNKCIICESNSFFLKLKNGYTVEKCGRCGLEFTNPMPTEAQFSKFYSEYEDVRANVDVSRKNATKNLKLMSDKFGVDCNFDILDFGCGNNSFVKRARELGYENSFGYDPYFCDSCDSSYVGWDVCSNKKWDVITLWGVLEHVPDPVELLTFLSQILKEKGVIVITTVTTESSIPYQIKPPEHTMYFTMKSFDYLASICKMNIDMYEDYCMFQSSDVYMSIILRTVPEGYRNKVSYMLPKFVYIPTNEILVVLRK